MNKPLQFTTALLLIVVISAGTVHAASTVRITPDYLRKIYRENLALYEVTNSDSATIMFARGTLQRTEDLAKLHEADQDAFVRVLLEHVRKRTQLVIDELKESPVSAEERLGNELPKIYRDLYTKLVELRKKGSTEDKRWNEAVSTARRAVDLIHKQLQGPGTSMSSPNK